METQRRARVEPFARESQFQAAVEQLARQMGLFAYHTHSSQYSEAGFPDLVIVGGRGVLYRELKMPKGKLSVHQEAWIRALTEAGENAGVWRPEHWPGLVTAELVELGRLSVRRPSLTPQQARAALRKGLTGRQPQS